MWYNCQAEYSVLIFGTLCLQNIVKRDDEEMKKISALFVAAALAAVATVPAFAAGINSAEQAVLDELSGSVTMSGTKMVVSDEYLNQVNNYFNTIEMTEEQSKTIIAEINNCKKLLENSDVANIDNMSKAQKQELMSYGEKAADVVDLSMSYDKSTKQLTISDESGTVVFKAQPTLVKLSASESSENNSTNNTSTGSSTTTGKITDSYVIKTTGFDVNTSAVAGVTAGAVALSAVGAIYAVKSRKERA